MAQIEVGSFEAGAVRFLLEYNANNGRGTGITCVNQTDQPGYGEAFIDGAWQGQVFNPGTSTIPLSGFTVRVDPATGEILEQPDIRFSYPYIPPA